MEDSSSSSKSVLRDVGNSDEIESGEDKSLRSILHQGAYVDDESRNATGGNETDGAPSVPTLGALQGGVGDVGPRGPGPDVEDVALAPLGGEPPAPAGPPGAAGVIGTSIDASIPANTAAAESSFPSEDAQRSSAQSAPSRAIDPGAPGPQNSGGEPASPPPSGGSGDASASDPNNTAPVVNDDTATTDENTAVTIDVIANDTDADGDPLTVTGVSITSGQGSVSVVNNALVYDPGSDYDQLGVGDTATVTLNYTASDGAASDSGTVTLTVTGSNDGPVAVADTATTDEDTAVTIDVLANDSDPDGDALTLAGASISGGQGNVSVVNNALVYDPDGQYDALLDGESATVQIDYTVTDAQGASTQQTATVTVTGGGANPNTAPVVNDDTATTDENTAVTIDVIANDTDADGDPLTVTGVSITSGQGSVSVVNNALVYDPGSDYDQLGVGDTATVTLNYTASDGAASDSGAVTLTVTGSNDGPVAVADTATTDEDTAVTIDVLANDSDPDGDALTLAGASISGGQGNVSVVNNALVYDPDGQYDALLDGESATVQIDYTVTDAQGASTQQTATVTVTGGGANPNTAPVVNDDTATTDENTAVTIDVIANDTDADGDPLTVTGVSITSGQGSVSVVNNALVYDPGSDYDQLAVGDTATVTLNYTASDGAASDSGTVTLTVTGSNDGPVAVADTATTDEGTAVTIDVLANDSDPDGDALTLAGASISGGQGNVSVVNNALVYDPDGQYDALLDGESATVQIDYTVTDAQGASTQQTATVTVTGGGANPNTAPVVNDDTATTDENTAVTIDVIANDTDADGDPLTVTGVSITSGQGSVSVVNNALVYDPGSDYDQLGVGDTATVTLNYTASDGAASDSGTVTLTVTGSNDGPVAVADTATTDEDTAVTIDVLANDSDPDGDALTLAGASISGGQGNVSVVNNALVYDPDGQYDALLDGESATVQIDYTVTDAQGASTQQTATVTVTGVNDAPVIAVSATAVPENSPVGTLVGQVQVTDPDAPAGHAFNLSDDAGGVFAIDADGNIEVLDASALDYETNTSFDLEVEITDNHTGEVFLQDVTIVVLDEECTHYGTDESASGLNLTLTLDVIQNISTPGDPVMLTTAVVTSPNSGSVGIVDNQLVFDPGNDFIALLPGQTQHVDIDYTVTFANGETAAAVATIEVEGSVLGLLLGAHDVGDVIIGCEEEDYMYGLAGDDQLYGRGGDDELYGGEGDDLLHGGVGADRLDGGSGNDAVSYAGASAAVNVDLVASVASGAGGDATGDVLIDIESAVGTDFDDVLKGDAGENTLSGGDGNDVLIGGAAADFHIGGSGVDAAIIQGNLSDFIYVRLADGSLQVGVDTFVGVEHLHFDDVTIDILDLNGILDTLSGVVGGAVSTTGAIVQTLHNLLETPLLLGGGGGAGSDDSFVGDPDNDTVQGGAGNDVFYYALGDGQDLFHGGVGGNDTDTLDLSAVVAALPGEQQPFAVALDTGQVFGYDLADGNIQLGADAAGTVTLLDSTQITFAALEQIEW